MASPTVAQIAETLQLYSSAPKAESQLSKRPHLGNQIQAKAPRSGQSRSSEGASDLRRAPALPRQEGLKRRRALCSRSDGPATGLGRPKQPTNEDIRAWM